MSSAHLNPPHIEDEFLSIEGIDRALLFPAKRQQLQDVMLDLSSYAKSIGMERQKGKMLADIEEQNLELIDLVKKMTDDLLGQFS